MPEATTIPPEHINVTAEAVLKGSGAIIHYGEHDPMYLPARDVILMPRMTLFTNVESYYAVGFHELGHWTGHPSRLNRDMSTRFGNAKYAYEELVAELTSAFICASLNITGDLRHAGYLDNWLQLLRQDKKAIFTASAQAQKAANYIFTPPH